MTILKWEYTTFLWEELNIQTHADRDLVTK